MWGRFSNLASMVTGQDEGGDDESAPAASMSSEADSVSDPSDVQIQVMEQERLILQLKEMIRERDKTLTEKETQLKKVAAEFSKHRLLSKSKIASLGSRLDESQKTTVESLETASVCSDESTSTLASEASSVMAEQTSRARTLVLKKRLKEKDQKLAEKDAVIRQKQLELEAKERVLAERESAAKDVSVQLTEQTNLVEHLRTIIRETTDGATSAELTTKKQLESRLEEMISQMVHKDSKILDLINQLMDKDKAIMDLQEHISEKDEVIRGRDQAISLLKSLQSQSVAGGQNIEETSQKLICELTEKLAIEDNEIKFLKEELEKKHMEANEREALFRTADEAVKTLEKKLLDAGDHVSLKSEESEKLKIELVKKEGFMLDMTEQLNLTLKELEMLKEMERQWSLERSQLLQTQKFSDEAIDKEQLLNSFKQLETSYNLLKEEHMMLRQSFNSTVEELEKARQDRELESSKAQEAVKLHEKQVEELQRKLEQTSGATPDSKFAKFKALAGSKIKALEKEVEELKQQSLLTDQVAALRNHIAELEEEKGNLQLQVMELEEMVAKQGSEKLKQELEELQSQYSDLEETSNSQKTVIAEMKTTIEELEREETVHRTSAAKAKEELESLISELKLEVENSRFLMDSKQVEYSNLMSKMQELDAELSREKTDLLKLIQINQDLKDQNAELSDSLANAKQQIEGQNNLVSKLESENSSIIGLMKAEEEKVITCMQSLHESSIEIPQLNSDLQLLQRKLAECEEKERDFLAQGDVLPVKNAEIQSLQEAVKAAAEEMSVYKMKEQEYLAEVGNLRSKESEIQILNDRVQLLTEKLLHYESKESEYARQSSISVERESENTELIQRLANMSEQFQIFDRRIEEMTEIENQLQADNKSLRNAVLQKDDNIQLLMMELNSGITEIQELKSNAALEIQNRNELMMKLKKLEEDLEERGFLMSDLEATALNRESELSKLKNSEDLLGRLKEENKAFRIEIDQKILDIQRLMTELEETQLLQRQTAEKVNSLEKSLSEKDEEVHKTSSDGEILQTEIESLTSRLRKSEDQVHVLEKRIIDGERKVESLTQNLDEEEMQLVSVTEELERLKTCLTDGQLNEEKLQKQLILKDEEMKLLSDMLQEKEVQSKKYLTLIKKLKQKQQSDVLLQHQNDSFSSELQLCRDELDEKNVEIIKMQKNLEEIRLILNDRTEELERLRPVAEELREMTSRCSDLKEEVGISKLEHENLNKDFVAVQLSLGQKEMLLSSIQSEVNVECEEDILGRLLFILEQEQKLHLAFSEQKKQIETKEAEVTNISHHREELSRRILDLERDVSTKDKELQVIGSSREDLSFQLGQSEQEKLYLTEELNSSQILLTNRDSLIAELNSEIKHLQSVISENKSLENISSAEVASLKQENSLLLETLAKLKEENSGLASSVEQLNTEHFSLVNKLDASVEELSKLKNEIKSNAVNFDEVDSVRSHLSEVENLNEQLRLELQNLNTKREAVTDENLQLTSSLEQLKTEVDQQKNLIADQEVELDTLSNRLQILTSENSDLKKDLDEALVSVSDFKLEHSRAVLAKSHLDSSVIHLSADLQKLMAENCQLKLTCDSLSAKLEDVEMEKLEVSSQLSRLTTRGLESEALIKNKESQDGVIRELRLEMESLRRSSAENSAPKEDFTLLENIKLQCSDLEKKCEELCLQLDTSKSENDTLLESLTKSNDKYQLAASQIKEFELKLVSCKREHDELHCLLEEEKIRLEAEAVKLRERAAKAEAAVQQLLSSTEMERQQFAKVESELQGTAEELELLVARLTQKVEILEERNEKQVTDGQLKINELLLQLETCLEEKKQIELMMKSEKEHWKEKETGFISDLEQIRLERFELEKEMQRKSSESSEQYDMLADDIHHYQDLVDQLKAKNFTLEQTLSHLKDNKAMETENQILRNQLEELNELRLENSSLSEEIEGLRCQVRGLTETHEEVDDVMSRLFSSMSENEDLRKTLNEQNIKVEEHIRMESELAELNDKYDKTLQNNSVLIHQIEEMYAMIKVYKAEEAETALLKDRHQKLENEYTAITESHNRVRQELENCEIENKTFKELVEKREKEMNKTTQLKEERLVTKAASPTYERFPPSTISDDMNLDDETPKIHAPAFTSDLRKLLNERDLECRQLNSKVDELSSQKDQLISALHQREHEMTNVHQQFQLLYQQYAILQQHYTALAAEQQKDLVNTAVHSSGEMITAHPPSQDHDSGSNTAVAVLSKKLEDSEKLCKELAEETNRLEQHLELEKEKRFRLEDTIGRMQEQMKLQQLSTEDSHAITMVEPEEERKMFRSKLNTAFQVSRKQCPDVQRWFDGCSILLGRVLRGQPQVRKALFLYIVVLHVYVIFGCLLAML